MTSRAKTTAGILRRPNWAAIACACALLVSGCDSVEDQVAQSHQRGMELKEAGDIERAGLEFRNAILLDGDFAPSHFEYGQVLREKREYQRALNHFRAAYYSDPEHAKARAGYAEIMLLGGRIDDAITQSKLAADLAPNDADILALHATAAFRSGDIGAALDFAEKADRIEPGHMSAGIVVTANLVATRGPGAAVAKLTDLIVQNGARPEDARDLRLLKLAMLQQVDDPARAGDYAAELTRKFPLDAGFRRAYAAWLLRQGDQDGALEQLKELANSAPNDVDAALDLVQFIVSMRGYGAARTELAQRADAASDPLDLRFALAALDYENGQADQAVAILRELIDSDAAETRLNPPRVMLAQIYATQDRSADAQRLIKLVLEIDVKNIDALGVRAALRLNDGALDEALGDVRAALNESPDNPMLLNLAARIYERKGRAELANESLSAAVFASDYAPEMVFRYVTHLERAGRSDTAESVLMEAVARYPENAKIWGALAQARLRLGKWTAAEKATRKLTELEGGDDAKYGGIATRMMAEALRGQERYSESIDLLRKEVARATDSSAAAQDLARLYVLTGEEQKAADILDALISDDPRVFSALMMRAALALRMESPQAAKARYLNIVKDFPDAPQARLALAQLQLEMGDGEAAEATTRKAISELSDPNGAKFQLAIMMENAGDINAAIKLYEEIFAERPEAILVANNLASLISDHRADDSEALKRAIMIAEPLREVETPAFQDTYGWLLYLNGDYNSALPHLRKAADGLPENAWVRFHIGMAYVKLGDPVQARAHLEAAIANAGPSGFSKVAAARAALDGLDG